MTSSHYLTARCLAGCETWLHPAAVDRHIDLGRCRGQPWVDAIPDAVLVPARWLRGARNPSPSRAGRPTEILLRPIGRPGSRRVPQDRSLPRNCGPIANRGRAVSALGSSRESHRRPRGGGRRPSRDDGGGLRRARARTRRSGRVPRVSRLQWSFVKRTGLATHRSRNVACPWRRAVTEVREPWQLGWRDPFSVPDGPLNWSELRARGDWRWRLRPVNFPRWTAVLLTPPSDRGGMTAVAVRKSDSQDSTAWAAAAPLNAAPMALVVHAGRQPGATRTRLSARLSRGHWGALGVRGGLGRRQNRRSEHWSALDRQSGADS